MVIDIDSFLEEYNSKKEVEGKKVEKKINLDFQKDVEDQLVKVEKKGIKSDYEALKKIYSEVKNFDLDLTSKFLGIDGGGESVIKELGEKYSDDFLKRVKSNMDILSKLLKEDFIKVKSYLDNGDFINVLNIFNDILNKYDSFPSEFIKNKIELSNKIKILEIEIYKKIENYKTKNLVQVKINLKKSLTELNNSLKPGNINFITEHISNIHFMLNSIPKIFISDISKEKILALKVIMKAEKYLENEYFKEFNSKKQIIDALFDKFHKNYINGNVEETILSYDEILFQFNSLPDVYLDSKIAIYKEINNLYVSINKLLIKNQVSTFLEGYNSSKILEEVREYLRHSKLRQSTNKNNLKLLFDKLNMVSEKYTMEKTELSNEIKQYILKIDEFENKVNKNKIRSSINKEFDEKLNNLNKKRNANSSSSNNNNKIMKEINKHYLLIKSSNNPKEVKIAYKKILFYLDLVHISSLEKDKLKLKIRNTLSKKRFN